MSVHRLLLPAVLASALCAAVLISALPVVAAPKGQAVPKGLSASQVQPSPKDWFPVGIWYEGGVGGFRDNVIPEDPAQAAAVYKRNFADIAAHGVDAACVPNTQPNHYRPLLDAAQAAGVRLIVELDRDGGDLGAMVRGSQSLTDSAVQDVLARKLQPIKSHPALWGVQILDEPPLGAFARFGAVADAIRSFAPGLRPFCCIIGASEVDQFVSKGRPSVVAFDFYPVSVHTALGDPAPMRALGDAARQAAMAADKHGVPVWAVLQTHAITGIHRFPTPAEMRCMTHLSLAGGCRGVWYFLYQTEYFNRAAGQLMSGLVDQNFKGSVRWAAVPRLAADVRSLAPVLRSLHPADDAGLSCPQVAHVLRDSKGRPYIYVVNVDTLRQQTVSVRFTKPAGTVRVVQMPQRRLCPSTVQGDEIVWQQRLAPGAGALFALETPKEARR